MVSHADVLKMDRENAANEVQEMMTSKTSNDDIKKATKKVLMKKTVYPNKLCGIKTFTLKGRLSV